MTNIKYHINPDTGRVNICRAEIKCDFSDANGAEPPHFGSKRDAISHRNLVLAEKAKAEGNEFGGVSKKSSESGVKTGAPVTRRPSKNKQELLDLIDKNKNAALKLLTDTNVKFSDTSKSITSDAFSAMPERKQLTVINSVLADYYDHHRNNSGLDQFGFHLKDIRSNFRETTGILPAKNRALAINEIMNNVIDSGASSMNKLQAKREKKEKQEAERRAAFGKNKQTDLQYVTDALRKNGYSSTVETLVRKMNNFTPHSGSFSNGGAYSEVIFKGDIYKMERLDTNYMIFKVNGRKFIMRHNGARWGLPAIKDD